MILYLRVMKFFFKVLRGDMNFWTLNIIILHMTVDSINGKNSLLLLKVLQDWIMNGCHQGYNLN